MGFQTAFLTLRNRKVLVARPNGHQYGHLGLEILFSLGLARASAADLFLIRPRSAPGQALFDLDSNEVRVLRPPRPIRLWLRAQLSLREVASEVKSRRVDTIHGFKYELRRELREWLRTDLPDDLRARLRGIKAWLCDPPDAQKLKQRDRPPYFRRRLLRNPIQVFIRPGLLELAQARAAELGIGSDAKIVTVHARESGYKRGREMQDTKPESRCDDTARNARIETYFEAIDFLVKRGYTVVRIGDPTMTPVRREGVIDLATSPRRSHLLEVYCLLKSDFLVAGESGLLGVSYLTNTPLLTVNATEPISAYPIRREGMFVMKRIVHKKAGRSLALDDMLTVAYQSSLRDTRKYTYVDNTPEEIFMAVREMLQLLEADRIESEGQRAVRGCVTKGAAALQGRVAYVRKWGLDEGFLGDGRMARFQADQNQNGSSFGPIEAADRA